MGDPKTVACKYLDEKGIILKEEDKPIKTSWFKWTTVCFFGILIVAGTFMLIILWKFSPIISVGEGGVSILGGLITIGKSYSKIRLLILK